MVAIGKTHVIIPPIHPTKILMIPPKAKAKGSVYLMTTTAPWMGQSTSGANVTEISMVTILGPANLPMATPATSPQPQANTPDEDTNLPRHLKSISPSDKIKTPPARCPRRGPKAIKDTRTLLTMVIIPRIITKTTTTTIIMSATTMMKIAITTMTTYRKVQWRSKI